MKRLLPWILLAACGAEGADSAPKEYALCDGSDGVRLAIMNVGGQLDASSQFSNPYGWEFLFVTGRCSFLAMPEFSRSGQLVSGTLSADQAGQIAAKLAPLVGKTYRAQGSCADGSTTQVMIADGYAEAACGDEPPASVAEILSVSSLALPMARASGTPRTGAVDVLAIGYPETKPINVNPLEWPFAWPIADASVQWSTTSGAPDLLERVRTLSDVDAELARQLRSNAIALPSYRGHIDITSGDVYYELYVRDHIDPAVQSAIASFRNANDPYIPKLLTLCKPERVLQDVSFDAPSAYESRLSVSTTAQLECDAELCWDGSFAESETVQATLRVERPEQPRSCVGKLPYITLNADLQPIIDAFHAAYPGQPLKVSINLIGAPATTGELSETP